MVASVVGLGPLWGAEVNASSELAATSWAAQRCLAGGDACRWLLLWHRSAATPVAGVVLLFVFVALLAGGWSRRQWPLLLAAVLLVAIQVSLGITTLRLGLDQPLVTVAHQLVAALLVGVLAALLVLPPVSCCCPCPVALNDSSLETLSWLKPSPLPCHARSGCSLEEARQAPLA